MGPMGWSGGLGAVGMQWAKKASMWPKKGGDPPLLVRGLLTNLGNIPPTAASTPYKMNDAGDHGQEDSCRGGQR